jgi:hypothetical protein
MTVHSDVSLQYSQTVRPRVWFVKPSTDVTFGRFSSIFTGSKFSCLVRGGVPDRIFGRFSPIFTGSALSCLVRGSVH